MKKDREPYIAVCRQHWCCFLLPGFVAVVFLFCAVVSLAVVKQTGAWLPLALFLVALVAVLYAIVSYKTTYIALTSSKVIGRKGTIRSKTLMTPLSKIQNVGLSNGLGGKIFRYHTVTLSDAGGAMTEYVFKRMARANAFAEAVHRAMEDAEKI